MKSRNAHADTLKEVHMKGSLNTEGFDSFEHKPPLPSMSYDSIVSRTFVTLWFSNWLVYFLSISRVPEVVVRLTHVIHVVCLIQTSESGLHFTVCTCFLAPKECSAPFQILVCCLRRQYFKSSYSFGQILRPIMHWSKHNYTTKDTQDSGADKY